MKVMMLACGMSVASSSSASSETVLVTGATGRTGEKVYLGLQSRGYTVRALVQNVTKARMYLHCTACDASEGIFEADIMKPNSAAFQAAFTDVDRVVITTGPNGHWTGVPYVSKYVYDGGLPKDVTFQGTKNQVEALLMLNAPSRPRHVLYTSTPFTTQPDNFLDNIGKGWDTFYRLNAEAFILAQQVPYTLLKICGLADGPGNETELLSGHDDTGYNNLQYNTVQRADVAAIFIEAIVNPELGQNLRFDLCSKKGSPPKDLAAFIKDTKYSWQQ